MDSNHRRRKPADLQSAPFGHSGICPLLLFATLISELRCKGRHYFDTYQMFLRFFSKKFVFVVKLFFEECERYCKKVFLVLYVYNV